jgi:PQQ-like domain
MKITNRRFFLGLLGSTLAVGCAYGSSAFAQDTANYKVLGQDKGKVSLVDSKGHVEWEYECRHGSHDIHLLPNGNFLLHTSPTQITEVTRDKKVVWQYESKPADGYKGRIEVHAFERLSDGLTMIAESGPKRIIEVDAKGKIVKQIPLTVEHPDPHRDTRMVRKLKNGHYLVCHEGDGCVREYDAAGKVVWSYSLDLFGQKPAGGHGPEAYGNSVYGAIRLDNGNTLIAGGNNHRVLEVDAKGKIVWKLDQKELPGITLAWVTTLHALPNGNIIIGNCHANAENPQLIEVTRDKKVVWSFNNQKVFGNDLAVAQVLGTATPVIR